MRYTIQRSGRIAASAHSRATVDEALALAKAMLAECSDRETISIIDNQTGDRYRGEEELGRLADAVETERDS